MTSFRPALSPFALNVAVATYILTLCNSAFWARLNSIFAGQPVWGFIFAFAIWVLLLLVLTLFTGRWLQKPVLVAVLLITGITSYFTNTMGVMIDQAMVGSALGATFADMRHVMSLPFLQHLAIYAAIPILLVVWIRIRRMSLWRGLVGWSMLVVGSSVLCIGLLGLNFRGYSAAMQSNPDLVGSVQPLGPMQGMLRYAQAATGQGATLPGAAANSAQKGAALLAAGKPVLMVVVAGAASEARNWSLAGYDRATNPALATRQVTFLGVKSPCVSDPATALPCLFQSVTDPAQTAGADSLLSLLATARVKLEWWEAGGGDMGAAGQVPVQQVTTDSAVLVRLAALAQTMTEDTLVVLHQGDGPAATESFVPACKPGAAVACTTEETSNAADNAVAETDRLLSAIADALQGQTTTLPAMVYLAATTGPVSAANDATLPMVIWMSSGFQAALGVSPACLAGKAAGPGDLNPLPATVLGLMDISSNLAGGASDLTAGCRSSGG